MATLYDANVWLAMAFAAHPHHRIASRHFKSRDSIRPAGFCRVTQQAFLRLVSTPNIQRAYGSPTITNASTWAKCEELLALPQTVWLEEPDDFPNQWQTLAAIGTASPKVWTDAYLAAFAICHNIGFVTLDHDFKKYEKIGLKLELLT